MARFLLRRLLILPVLLLLVNFGGYAYALLARYSQARQNPMGTSVETAPPVFSDYQHYLQGFRLLDFGTINTGSGQPVAQAVLQAAGASLGLLGIAFAISLALGLALGLGAVRSNPGRTARWLTPLAAIGQSLPSFYIGALFIVASLIYLLNSAPDNQPLLPVAGFGWDAHLIAPVVALSVRPILQIAQVTAVLLAGELDKQYVTAARAIGQTWRRVRWVTAMRNILAPVLLAVAGSFRFLLAELILVEYLFSWPGLGRLLAQTVLIPASILIQGPPPTFLNPSLLAALLTLFAFLFVSTDTLASALARWIDPRISRPQDGGQYD